MRTCVQDTLFEAAHITSSFKALAIVESPDDEAALQRREEFLAELCSLTEDTLSALHPTQLVTLLWSCGRWLLVAAAAHLWSNLAAHLTYMQFSRAPHAGGHRMLLVLPVVSCALSRCCQAVPMVWCTGLATIRGSC